MLVLTAPQMAEADRRVIEDLGVPSILLMEQAGRECVEVLLGALDEEGEPFGPDAAARRILVVCGKGNNGGDGLVVARLLHRRGADVLTVLLWPGEELSGDAARNLAALRAVGGEVLEAEDLAGFQDAIGDLDDYDVIVDGVFGTGIRGAVQGWRGKVLDFLGCAPGLVVSVDVPSGLSGNAGAVEGPSVRADLTVTMAALKPPHVLPPACDRCGDVIVAEIGVPEEIIEELAQAALVDPFDAAGWTLPLWREPDAHKGRHGRVLVVAGSVGKSGAAALCALSALRSGAGLVTLAVPEGAWAGVAPVAPEVMVEPVEEGPPGRMGMRARDRLVELARGADVVAVGPGLGRADETGELVRSLLSEIGTARVVDADGLWALGLAGDSEMEGSGAAPLFLTPHPGEMSLLLDRDIEAILSDRPAAVREAADRYRAHVLLKGHRSLAAAPGGRLWINPTGGPVLATGGTGDVLTGLAAALVGQGVEPRAVLPVAAWVHGLAGDLAAAEIGVVGTIASDVLDRLPGALEMTMRGLADEGDLEAGE